MRLSKDSIVYNDKALTQEAILNRLTNNDQNCGIFLDEGELYINASYIKTGFLSADHIKGGTLVLGDPLNGIGAELIAYDDLGGLATKIDDFGLHAVIGEIGCFYISTWGLTMRGHDTQLNDISVGEIGLSYMNDYRNKRGFSMLLEEDGEFLAFGVKEPGNSRETNKLVYAYTATGGYTADRWTFETDISLKDHKIYSATIDPNTSKVDGSNSTSKTLSFQAVTSMGGDGKALDWTPVTITIKNGFVTQFTA